MSFEALNWAWKVRGIPGPAKTVLARLACMTNGTGVCWPSYATLAADCCFDRRTVIRSINLLCEAGLVEKIPDGGPSNKYRLLVSESHQVVTHSHQVVTESHQVVTESHQTSDRESPKPKRTIKESKTTTPLPPTLEPKPEADEPPEVCQPERKKPNGKKPEHEGFDLFWKAYPRKVAKVAAQKAWQKHKPPLQDVLKAVKAQSLPNGPLDPSKEKTYIPHPATWLNAGRWMDETESSQATTRPTFIPTNPEID